MTLWSRPIDVRGGPDHCHAQDTPHPHPTPETPRHRDTRIRHLTAPHREAPHVPSHPVPARRRARDRLPHPAPRRRHRLGRPGRRHLRGEVPPGRQGAPGLLGELGRRRQRRPPALRLDPDHGFPHPRPRLQRDQRGLPGDPLRRHGAVAGRHGLRGEGAHARGDVRREGRRRDGAAVHRGRDGGHRPQLHRGGGQVRLDDRADPEAVQLRRHRHRHRDGSDRQREHQPAVAVPGQPDPHHRRHPRPHAGRLRPDDGPGDGVRHRRQHHLRFDLGRLSADHQEVRRQRPAVVAEHAVLQRQHVRLLRRLLRGRHGGGLHRPDRLPEQGPGGAGHDDQGALRQAGPGPARTVRRGRRLHVPVPGLPVLAALRHVPQGPDGLVHQLGRLQELDLRRQRQGVAGPLRVRRSAGGGRRARPDRSRARQGARKRPPPGRTGRPGGGRGTAEAGRDQQPTRRCAR
ncbi:hypothetical protein SGPA1_30591 [Streptomyces misionensis JCM 4497]